MPIEKFDTREQANVIAVNHAIPQPHTLHYAEDYDWVKFYGLSGEDYTYRIKAGNLGVNCKPVIELYYGDELTFIRSENTIMYNEVFLDFDPLKEGTYYVKVIWNDTYPYVGGDTSYELQVDNQDAGGLLVLITGSITDVVSGAGIDGAWITIDGGGATFSSSGTYYLYQKPGPWLMQARAEGFELFLDQISVQEEDQIFGKYIMMDPIVMTTSTTTSIRRTTTTTTPTTTTTIIECTSDSNCDDDLFCNGKETCVEGVCHSGSNPCLSGEECDEETDICRKPITPCSISIDPGTAEVLSGESMSFTITSEGDCAAPRYEWSVKSNIGSSIDQSGSYKAGINADMFNKATDEVKVVDQANGTSSEASVTISWGNACLFLQMFGEGSKEVKSLRAFRDNVLGKTKEGQELISLYYEWSPAIVKAMEEDKAVKEKMKAVVDGIMWIANNY
jgi:hypothetical protein